MVVVSRETLLPTFDDCTSYVGPADPLMDGTPVDHFLQFLTTDMLDLICEQSVLYARNERDVRLQ